MERIPESPPDSAGSSVRNSISNSQLHFLWAEMSTQLSHVSSSTGMHPVRHMTGTKTLIEAGNMRFRMLVTQSLWHLLSNKNPSHWNCWRGVWCCQMKLLCCFCCAVCMPLVGVMVAFAFQLESGVRGNLESTIDTMQSTPARLQPNGKWVSMQSQRIATTAQTRYDRTIPEWTYW